MHHATTLLPLDRPAFPISGIGQLHARSGLERTAGSIALVRPGRPTLLASALLAGLPRRGAEDLDILWPVWATEAVFRAESLLTLLAWLDRSRRHGAVRIARQLDLDLARSLGAQYQALQSVPMRTPLPCSSLLRDMAAALVSLFGDVSGRPVLHTDIARLVLPGFQRRALVLAATTLVLEALAQGARTPAADGFGLTLAVEGPTARLCVTVRERIWQPGPALVVAGALADLLEGKLVEKSDGQADIAFPIPVVAGR